MQGLALQDFWRLEKEAHGTEGLFKFTKDCAKAGVTENAMKPVSQSHFGNIETTANAEKQMIRTRLELIEALLVVLLIGAGIFSALYFEHTRFWLGVLCIIAALLLRNKIEDWFIDLRDRIL